MKLSRLLHKRCTDVSSKSKMMHTVIAICIKRAMKHMEYLDARQFHLRMQDLLMPQTSPEGNSEWGGP